MKYFLAPLLALEAAQTNAQNKLESNLLLDVETDRFIDSNPKADLFFNLSREQFALLSPLELGPKIIYPAQQALAHLQQSLKLALAGGNPVLHWHFLNEEGKSNPCEVMLLRFPPYDRSFVQFIFQDQEEQSTAQKKISQQAALLENVSDAIFSTDTDFKIQYWNKAAENLYGWTAEEVVGKVFPEMIFPSYPHSTRKQVIEEFDKNGSWSGEIITQNKKHEKLHILGSAKLIFDAKGVPTSTIAVHHDITEHKAAEKSRLISEEKFSKVFEFNANIMALVDLEEMMALEVNHAYTVKTGYEKEEILNKAGKFGFNMADQALLSKLTDVVRQNDHLSNVSVNIVAKDGSIIRGLVFVEPIEINGKKRYIVTIVDVSAQKAAEDKLVLAQAELSKFNKRYQLAIQSARVGIWDWDLKTNEFVWDDMMYKLYGLNREKVDINYELWARVTHPDDLGEAETKLKEALAGKDEIQSDVRIIWPDQSIRHIRTRVILQRDEAGQPARMIGTNWDRTKEIEIEQAKADKILLETRNKELEQFAYVASHDLKEPIRTMISFAGLLKKRHSQDLDQAAKEYLEFIYLAANRMNELVKGLLEYSRLGINKELSSVNCQIVFQTVLRDLSVLIEEKKAIVEVKNLPTIPGYQTELRILFQNLISNAIKFVKLDTPPIIQVSATRIKANWVFRVKDNGIGIEPEYLHKVFEIFQRLNPQEQYKGTGIGLANCQKIAELHGGKIWVESQIDKGSSFYVSLPNTFFQEESLS
ncbi:MAG: PAS domain S-box protein [Bacteroidia bacterium]